MNKSKIIPSRIKEARESRGLSMSELSDIIEVSSQAISQYEKGIISPTINILNKIALELDFPIKFFFEEIPSEVCSNSAIYFRAMKSTSKKLKTAYSYRITWADNILNYFKKYIEFQNINFPIIDGYEIDKDLDFTTIEEISYDLREFWKLSSNPIKNLIDTLEDNGVIICRISFKNEKIEAFSQWHNGVPFIFIGANRDTSVSLRFSIAHELGHLIMHSSIGMQEIYSKKILDRIENEANIFASSFLMPVESFPQEIIHNSLDYLILLKEKWKVSLSAMIRRCKDLNLMSENQTDYLNRQMTIKKYWRREPLDDKIPVENPSILKEALLLLIDNNIITPTKFLEDIVLPKNEIIKICSLDENYFDYIQIKNTPQLRLIK